MKKYIIISLLGMTLFTGCGKNNVEKSVEVRTQTVQVPANIENLVAEENEYRLKLGQTILSNGLSCTLSTVTGGDRIQASIVGHNTLTGITQVASFLYKEAFNQPDSSVNDGLNVLPLSLRNIYKNLYLLRCQGYVVITETNYHQFDLYSDDGSVLYLDGAKLVDSDNNHSFVLASGTKYLRRGIHTFRLDYAQTGSGNQGLVLNMDSSLLEGNTFYH